MTATKTATVSSLSIKGTAANRSVEVEAEISFYLPDQHPQNLDMKVEFVLPKMPDVPRGDEDSFLFEVLRRALEEPLTKLPPSPKGAKH